MKYRALLLCLLIAVLPSHVVFAQQDDADIRFGSVLVRSMDKIVVVAMDTGGEDSPGDGFVDQVFVYFLPEPLSEPFSFRTDRAMVLFGKNRVQVTSPDGPTTLTFTVQGDNSPRPRPRPGRKTEICPEEPINNILSGGSVPRSLSLENGVGLAHYPKVNNLPFSQFEHGDLTRLNYRELVSGIPGEFDIAAKCGGAPQCASGGPGSTGCSVSTCCSVNCGSGYYACCHCTNGCNCVRN